MTVNVEGVKISLEVNVSDGFEVLPVAHDKCDVQLLDEFFVCEMNGEALECALNKCTGDKFKCDCNVYGYVWKFIQY